MYVRGTIFAGTNYRRGARDLQLWGKGMIGPEQPSAILREQHSHVHGNIVSARFLGNVIFNSAPELYDLQDDKINLFFLYGIRACVHDGGQILPNTTSVSISRPVRPSRMQRRPENLVCHALPVPPE
jgi:hypothetical protein